MVIAVYRWTDGPYVAFTDDQERRYVLERGRASLLLERMRAHLSSQPSRDLIVHRRFIRDHQRDLAVLEMYLQDCDNYVEVITATSPVLLITLVESCTLLRLATDRLSTSGPRLERDIPSFLRESVLTVLPDSDGLHDAPYG